MRSPAYNALVVDDDPIARKMVGFALEREDFSCDYAEDGEEALQRLTEDVFDLVVTDLRMPNKHGHALAVELLERKHPPLIIVHSSIDDPRLTKDLMMRGVDDIVYKPTNYQAFAAKMRSLVARRRTAAALTALPAATDNGSRKAASPAAPARNQPATTAAATGPRPSGAATSSVVAKSMTANGAGRPRPTAAPAQRAGSPTTPPIEEDEYVRRLANVQHLFPLSSAAYEVFMLANCENTGAEKLVRTMLHDAALTADVLRLANSSYYNRQHRPTIDLEEAVVRIGFKKVGEVALALNALTALRGCIVPWLDADIGQARGLAASVALERLCERRNYRTSNDGMTLCAFLYPLGRLVLGSAFQDEYQLLTRISLEQSLPLHELEARVFPESHTAALGRVLSLWNLPEEIWRPLLHLEDDYETIAHMDEPCRSQVEIVKLAVFIGELAVGRWMPWDGIAPPPRNVLVRHQLADLTELIERTRADLGKLAQPNGPLAEAGQSAAAQDQWGPPSLSYRELSSHGGGWFPLLMMALGFDPIQPTAADSGSAAGVVNALDVPLADLQKELRGGQAMHGTSLFILSRSAQLENARTVNAISLPASVAAIRNALEHLARDRATAAAQYVQPPVVNRGLPGVSVLA